MENRDDFKYILQDTTHVYFGKELSYNEMMDKDEVPFKFKAIIGSYVSKDVDLETKISDHLLNIDKQSFTYRIFDQIKMEIKYFYKEETNTITGKKKVKWVHKTCKVQKIEEVQNSVLNNEASIEEISISKLALMMIAI